MKYLPFVLWMLLFPVSYYLAEVLSAYSNKINNVPYVPISNEDKGGIAVMFFIIWFGVGVVLYYGIAKL